MLLIIIIILIIIIVIVIITILIIIRSVSVTPVDSSRPTLDGGFGAKRRCYKTFVSPSLKSQTAKTATTGDDDDEDDLRPMTMMRSRQNQVLM